MNARDREERERTSLLRGFISAITWPLRKSWSGIQYLSALIKSLRRREDSHPPANEAVFQDDEKKELDVVVPIKSSTAEISRHGIEVQPPSNQESKFDEEEVTHEDGVYQSVVRSLAGYSPISLEAVKEIDKELDAIFKRGLDVVTGGQLIKLLWDIDKRFACLRLLLEKHVDDIPIHGWVEIAGTHISHTREILKNKELSQRLLDSGWLKNMAAKSPEHARLIVKKFKGRLGEQEDLIVAFSTLDQNEITEAAKPGKRL